jgi:hypothetical protein
MTETIFFRAGHREHVPTRLLSRTLDALGSRLDDTAAVRSQAPHMSKVWPGLEEIPSQPRREELQFAASLVEGRRMPAGSRHRCSVKVGWSDAPYDW